MIMTSQTLAREAHPREEIDAAGPATFEQHLIAEQSSGALDPELCSVLSTITAATQVIAAEVASIGLGSLQGALAVRNGHGETVTKMDRFADQVMLSLLGAHAAWA
jgi:fructose-1,6-bisphosphatase